MSESRLFNLLKLYVNGSDEDRIRIDNILKNIEETQALSTPLLSDSVNESAPRVCYYSIIFGKFTRARYEYDSIEQ